MHHHRLLPYGYSLAWSPDGSKLAFDTPGQIFVVNSDGSGQTRLDTADFSLFPAWHPDGRRIAFDTTERSPAGLLTTVWMSTVGASDRHPIPEAPLGFVEPAWHPGGSKLAGVFYGRGADASTRVVCLDPASDSLVQLTHWSEWAEDRSPRFSPDGNRIAFASQRNGTLPQIWVMNTDGTGVRQLTTLGGSWPSWSPDGTELVYVRDNQRTFSLDHGVLWIINVETGVQRQLTFQWGTPKTYRSDFGVGSRR